MLVNPFNMPGMGTALTSSEYSFMWNTGYTPIFTQEVIDSTTVDARSSPTTQLCAGLLLGKVTSTGQLVNYSASATDGSQVPYGILCHNINMLNSAGTAVDMQGQVMIGGPVRGSVVAGLDYMARRAMDNRFIFDDSINSQTLGNKIVAKTADYTVTAADNNTLFTNKGAAGAVNFTLPTLAVGLRYQFVIEANQTVTVTGAASSLVVFNNAAATSIAFSTAGEKVGTWVEAVANIDATKWLIRVSLPAETVTPTIA